MSVPIVFITTFQIENGAIEKFKEAVRKSMDFLETNGPQLLAEVCIDESEMRAHGIQIHRDSESILTHWQLADPYIRAILTGSLQAIGWLFAGTWLILFVFMALAGRSAMAEES